MNITVFVKNPGIADPFNTARVEIDISIITQECMDNPCLNGAVCQDGADTFACMCLPGQKLSPKCRYRGSLAPLIFSFGY